MTAPLRIFIAPGESPDLLELLDVPVEVEEVATLSQVDPGQGPGVLFLSRSLSVSAASPEWQALPGHVAVIAADTQARGEAEKAGRLFLAMEDLRGDGGSLQRVLRAATRYSAALLRAGRDGGLEGG